MLDLAFLSLLTLWSVGVGLRVIRWVGPAPEHAADGLALAIPVGLGMLALAALGLGELGVLSRAGMLVVLAIGVGMGWREVRGWIDGTMSRAGARTKIRREVVDWLFDLALAATVLGTFLTALTPVTDGDALCYHLQVPKVFLAHRGVFFDPDLHETIYPLVTEMLYAVTLAFRGPVACRLVQWVFGLVFAANVTALARSVLGPRARWAGTVALLVPAVSNGMGAPLNDVALAAFGNGALFAWTRWLDRPSIRAAVLTGLLAGQALGVKYPALVLVGLIGLAMVLRGDWGSVIEHCVRGRRRMAGSSEEGSEAECHWRLACQRTTEESVATRTLADKPPVASVLPVAPVLTMEREPVFGEKLSSMTRRNVTRAVAHSILFVAIACLVGGSWYVRAFAHTGNPVYPFFRHTFGSGLEAVLDPQRRAMPVTAVNLLTALGQMTLHPDRFDSLSHQFGPAFLLFLPGLLLIRTPKRVWAITAMGFAFLTICLAWRQSMRFVLIAVGPMSVAVAWLASAWWARRSVPGRILVLIVVVMNGFEASLALARARHGIGVVLGREAAETYLSRREPTYRVAQWVDAHLPPTTHLIGQDHRGFYFPCAYTMELAHRRRTGVGTHDESPTAIVAHLLAAGFTHLLMCPPMPETAVEFDPTLGRKLDPWLAQHEPLYQADIADPDGIVRRYAIYDLAGGMALDAKVVTKSGGRLSR